MNSKKGKYFRFYEGKTDLEVNLVSHISKTGKMQIKKRRKAGLSVFYVKGGRIVEQKPDKTVIEGEEIGSKWITLSKKDRTLILK